VDELLELRVADDGVGMNDAKTAAEGMGLENCRQRLAGLYGTRGIFEIRTPHGGGTEVELRIPSSSAP
jgi:signal transduction histidine kinase